MPANPCCCGGGGGCYYRVLRCVDDSAISDASFACGDYPSGTFIIDTLPWGCLYVDTSTTLSSPIGTVYTTADTISRTSCSDALCTGCASCCENLVLGIRFKNRVGSGIWDGDFCIHARFFCSPGSPASYNTYTTNDLNFTASIPMVRFIFNIIIDDVTGLATLTIDVERYYTGVGDPGPTWHADGGTITYTWTGICITEGGTLAGNSTGFDPVWMFIACNTGTDDPKNYGDPLSVSNYIGNYSWGENHFSGGSITPPDVLWDGTLDAVKTTRNTCPGSPVTNEFWTTEATNNVPPDGSYSQLTSYSEQLDGTYEVDTVFLAQTGAPVDACDHSSPAQSCWALHGRIGYYKNWVFTPYNRYYLDSEALVQTQQLSTPGYTTQLRNYSQIQTPDGNVGAADWPIYVDVTS